MGTDTDETYSSEQYDDNYPDGVERSYWNLARNRIILGAVGPASGRVLDVGCGRGIVVDYLREHGVDCWGCELGRPRPIQERVSEYLMPGSDAGELEPAFAETVHTVMLLDVLEHLEEPEQLLQRCRAHFANAQRFVVTLPARGELWTNYDDHFGHRRRYDLASTRELLACVSPVRIDARYFFHLLYPPMRAVAALKRKRTVHVQAPSKWLAPIHRLVALGFRLDAAVLPRSLPGSSILASVLLH